MAVSPELEAAVADLLAALNVGQDPDRDDEVRVIINDQRPPDARRARAQQGP
jgi:hypothetical protein